MNYIGFFKFLGVELVILKGWISEGIGLTNTVKVVYSASSSFWKITWTVLGVYKVHLALYPVSKLANTRC